MNTANSDYKYNRSVSQAISHGVKGKCPNCGEGNLYDGFISVKDECAHCGEELHHHRADDLPPYLNIFIVGHIVVGLLMISMKYEWFGVWETTIGGAVLAVALASALMRPLKGIVVAIQWAMEMHGFSPDERQHHA